MKKNYLSRLAAIVLMLNLLLFPLLTHAASGDIKSPIMKSLMVDKNKLYAGESVTIYVTAEDDSSGVESVFAAIESPSGKQAEGTTVRERDSKGRYAVTLKLNEYAEEGLWKVRNITLTDKAGNTTFLNDGTDFTNEFEVMNDKSDTVNPIMKSLEIDKEKLSAGESITIFITAEDNLSSIESVFAAVESPSKKQAEGTTVREKDSQGRYVIQLKINDNAETGLWKVRNITLTDKAGNTTFLNDGTDFSKEFEVTNDKSDTVSPTMKSLEMDKEKLSAGESITIFITAEDNISGIESVFAAVESPSRKQAEGTTVRDKDSQGRYVIQLKINDNAETGLWKIRNITLTDNAGNTTFLLAEHDFNKEFEVTERKDTQAPYLFNFALNHKVATGENLKGYVTPRDDLSGVKSVSLIIEDPSGLNNEITFWESRGEQFEVTIPIEKHAKLGKWKVKEVLLTDYAGNTSRLKRDIDFAGDFEVYKVSRIYGEDRYKTAIEISKKGWSTASTVILAKGKDFPDALAGSPLALKEKAPILLTDSNKLTNSTLNEIKRLSARKVIILGGNSAISKEIEQTLKNNGLQIDRIGGANRYETAAKIAKRLSSTKAVVAYGGNFPDALSVAPYAAVNGIPILLTGRGSLPSPTKEALIGKSHTIVIGSTGVVSKEIFSQLPSPIRYGGANRYETSKEVISKLNIGTQKALVATGTNFPDALTGSVLAAKLNAPILLVGKEMPTTTKNLAQEFGNFIILGGNSVISSRIENELNNE